MPSEGKTRKIFRLKVRKNVRLKKEINIKAIKIEGLSIAD